MEKLQQTRPGAETDAESMLLAGKLKIFFGYAAGVGKTYAMLEAAHQAKKEGTPGRAGGFAPQRDSVSRNQAEGV